MKQNFRLDEMLPEEDAIHEARFKLRKARESAGKSPQEIAALIGISAPAYHDLEESNGELNMAISLAELFKLASVLGIRARFIFDDKTEGQPILPEQLSSQIKAYLTKTGISVADFESRVGFMIEPSLRDFTKVLNWNVDCLRSVCKELGINWLLALP